MRDTSAHARGAFRSRPHHAARVDNGVARPGANAGLGAALPDLPRRVPARLEVLERLLVLEGVHALPEALVRIGGEPSPRDEALERLLHELLALAQHVEDPGREGEG